MDPILIIASIKIKSIMKELMIANSVAVGFIIGSLQNILPLIKHISCQNMGFLNGLKLIRILIADDVNLVAK